MSGMILCWKKCKHFWAFFILVGVCKSNNEATRSFWDSVIERAVFRATMLLKMFHKRKSSQIWWQNNTTCEKTKWQAGTYTRHPGKMGGETASDVQSWRQCDCVWGPGSIQGAVPFQAIYTKQAWKIWHQGLGCLWCQNQLLLEYAGIYRQTGRSTAWTKPGKESSPWNDRWPARKYCHMWQFLYLTCSWHRAASK